MADVGVRQLELALARSPDDLEIRQRLLATYVRTAILQKGDLIELAALGDPGAILLTGKTPNLDSRTTRFYLRCAWGCLLEVYRLLEPTTLEQKMSEIVGYIPNWQPPSYRNAYQEVFTVMTTFNHIFDRFLRKEIKSTDEITSVNWRPDRSYSLASFWAVFNDRHTMLGDIRRGMPGYTDPAYDSGLADTHDTLEYLVWGYCHLCKAFEKKVKLETDEAIYNAAIALDRFRGNNYHLDKTLQSKYRVPYDYYMYLAKRLLQDSRSAIVSYWLPNYTPAWSPIIQ